MGRPNVRTIVRLLGEADASVLAFHAGYAVRQRLSRAALGARARTLPTALYVETSSFCRGRCRDCYVPIDDRRRHLRLAPAELDGLVQSARALGLDYVCIVGGEPLDDAVAELNVRVVRDHPDVRFLVCTGATARSDGAALDALARLRNVSLVFSFDGLEPTHDAIRGRGSFRRTCDAILRYGGRGRRLAGASVMLSRDNWDECTRPELIGTLCQLGCAYVVLDPGFGSQATSLTAAEYACAIRRLVALSTRAPAAIYVYPFGRISGPSAGLRPTMRTLSVDYRGNVYASRRGRSFGNIRERDLGSILCDEQLAETLAASGRSEQADDPRRSLFDDTLALLGRGEPA